MLKIYDSYDPRKSAQTEKGEDYTDIFKGADSKEPVHDVVRPLPNVYLGSIVYYSPKEWAVSVNGKKILNADNNPKNEFYISKISRKEVELIWSPKSLNDLPARWDQTTGGGKNPVPHVAVDSEKGTVTLNMHPNQTFVISAIAIQEGLVKPESSFYEKLKETISSVLPSNSSGQSGDRGNNAANAP
jgi:hypothetical protein